MSSESIVGGLKNRFLQLIARISPGATSIRVLLHKLRGVELGANVWIGYDVILETSQPKLITVGSNVSFGVRTTVIAHFKSTRGVIIEDDVYIGPSVTILPNVRIGKGSVVTAGSVVTKSVGSNLVVQGNPAVPIAICRMPLKLDTSLKDFTKNLVPLKKSKIS